MSLKSCHNFKSVLLAVTHLVLKSKKSSAGLPHCTGPQLIKILHYPTILRGYEKPLEPIHSRVILKNLHVVIYVGNSSAFWGITSNHHLLLQCKGCSVNGFVLHSAKQASLFPMGALPACPSYLSMRDLPAEQFSTALPAHPQPTTTCAGAGFL